MMIDPKIVMTTCILFLLVSHATTQNSGFAWPEGKKAAISISFDDARSSHPLVGLDLFQRLDMKATFYVNPPGVREYLDEWKKIVSEGHEIGNHTVYHPCTGNFSWARNKALEEYTLYTMRQELLEANRQIQDLLGLTPLSFAYTCGNTFVGRGENHQSYVPLVAELFQSGRGWLNEAANDPMYADMAMLQGIEMDNKDFETDILPMIENAVANGNWLLLAGHEIGEEGVQTTRIEMLEKLASYVQDPENKVWLAPVGTIADYVIVKREEKVTNLKEALTFAVTFDKGTQADYALGEPFLFTAQNYDQASTAIPHMLPEELEIAENRGRFGHALEFKRKGQPAIFYPAKDNISYNRDNWNGTISLWLSLDPETDLAPGYTDPIQITDAGYNDAALWVDFSNQNPRDFRMGVFGDLKVWNPDNINPDENPAFNNRLVVAEDTPFRRDRWTHVVITFSGLNADSGRVNFYINGQLQGSREIPEAFTWELEKAKIFLGLNFVGRMDEVAIFRRSLSENEVWDLYQLPEGLSMLFKQLR